MEQKIKQIIQESIETKQRVMSDLVEEIQVVTEEAIKVLRNNKKLMFCGNGGSAADSQHLAAEFVGRFQRERRGLPAVALTTDSSILTCIGNDYGFDHIFSRQVEAIGQEGDMLFGISTSGKSENIIKAFEQAQQQNIITVALVGRDGGPMASQSDHTLLVSSQVTARIQEAHICIGHILCELIENKLA